MGRVVLVTGVARPLGGQMARILAADPEVDEVVGVDVIAPRPEDEVKAENFEFVRADIRNPIIAKVIAAHEIDTVVHMGVLATPMQAGGRSTMKEINVIGTMQLLAACQRAESVNRLVVKSSSSVYGSGPKDPAMFTEETEPRHPPTSGWAKDSQEVEGYVRGFARRRSDVTVTTLRFANFIAPKIRTAMASYYALPMVPTVLGYDARMQFIHVKDGMEVLRRAVVNEHPGTFNVAGDGVLMLSQSVKMCGRPTLPVPPFALGAIRSFLMQAKLADFSPEQVRFLTYGRGIDTTRLKERFGFTPAYTTTEAFEDFAFALGRGLIPDEQQVRELEHSILSKLTGAGRVSA